MTAATQPSGSSYRRRIVLVAKVLTCCFLCHFFAAPMFVDGGAAFWRQALQTTRRLYRKQPKGEDDDINHDHDGCQKDAVTATRHVVGARNYDPDAVASGYGALDDAFWGMEHVWHIKVLKRLTFGTPLVDEVSELVDELTASGKRRKRELSKLQKLPPQVTRKRNKDLLGDAITQIATWELGKEIIDRRAMCNLSFVLVQNAATGAISAAARALIRFEPNPERKLWLKGVADEYRAFREQTVDIISKYMRGEGAQQHYVQGRSPPEGWIKAE